MAYQAHTSNSVRNNLARLVGSPITRTVSLLALCAAYIQGPLTKIFDFNGALAEMEHLVSIRPRFLLSLLSPSNW